MNKLYKKLCFLFIGLPCIAMSLAACKGASDTEPLRRTEFVLGTTATISLYDHKSEALLSEAFERISVLEDILSINKQGTLLDEVNANAGLKPTLVDKDLFDIIEKSLSYSKLTEGSFDITIGPIVKLWSIGFPEARVPSNLEIENKLPLIGYSKVLLDKTHQSVFLESKGMLLDLGGIGKGYVADEIVSLLKNRGVEHAIIDLGGNIYTLGNKPGDKLWKIGVQDPFNPRGNIIGHISVENKSVVTSGIYERFIEEDGKKYHHILDPKTGYPFENDIAGVTIISDKSADGDALSTSVFSKGIAEGLAFVNSLEGIDAIFITTTKKIYLTSEIAKNFVLTNDAFEIVSF